MKWWRALIFAAIGLFLGITGTKLNSYLAHQSKVSYAKEYFSGYNYCLKRVKEELGKDSVKIRHMSPLEIDSIK